VEKGTTGIGCSDSFDQNLSTWQIEHVTSMSEMFNGITLSTSNYDALLGGWSSQSVQSGVHFGGGNSQYSDTGQTARDTLTNAPNNWIITDGGHE